MFAFDKTDKTSKLYVKGTFHDIVITIVSTRKTINGAIGAHRMRGYVKGDLQNLRAATDPKYELGQCRPLGDVQA